MARRIGWVRATALVALGFALCWGAGMASIHRAPPLDSAEQLVWSYTNEGGYWKHPPLPSWILHLLVQLLGPSIELPFYLTQAGIAVALLILWRVGSEWMGPARSFLAATLTGLVGYYGWCADAFNHNSALLPFQAGATAAFWFAVRTGQRRWWVLVGVCGGLGILVKYVALLPLGALLAYALIDRSVRQPRTFMGIGLAGSVAFLVMAPHLAWLSAHDWLPLRYAHGVAAPAQGLGGWLAGAGAFLGSQLLRLAPLIVVAVWLAWMRPQLGAPQPAPAVNRSDRIFLWVTGAAPLILIVSASAVSGAALIPRWGYNVFLLVGWLAVDALRWPRGRVAAALRVSLAAHLMLWAATVVLVPRLAAAVGWQGRSTFPGAAFSRMARSTWETQTGERLRLVVSDIWLGGTLAAHNPTPLAVLADGEWARASWIRPQDLQDCGALVVHAAELPATDPVPGVTRLLGEAAFRGEWELPWVPWRGLHQPSAQTSRISWGVIPPRNPRACRL